MLYNILLLFFIIALILFLVFVTIYNKFDTIANSFITFEYPKINLSRSEINQKELTKALDIKNKNKDKNKDKNNINIIKILPDKNIINVDSLATQFTYVFMPWDNTSICGSKSFSVVDGIVKKTSDIVLY